MRSSRNCGSSSSRRVVLSRSRAHPDNCVTLQCEEVASLVDVARRSDTVLLAIKAAGPDLVELTLQPELAAMARFGLVTLKRRTLPPGLAVVRELMAQLLVDRPA